MKLLVMTLISLVSLSAAATLAMGESTQAVALNYGYDDGYGPQPGYGPGHGRRHPGYGGVTGPQYTVRWYDLGLNRLPKLVSEIQTIYVGGRLVNEILVRAVDNHVGIESFVAFLSDGQMVNLAHLTGNMRQGYELRGLVDRYSSLRIDRLEVRATSSNLIGTRAQMQVVLGLAE